MKEAMCRLAVVLLLSPAVQATAGELTEQTSTEDSLFNRMLPSDHEDVFFDHASLENTTLGKVSTRLAPRASALATPAFRKTGTCIRTGCAFPSPDSPICMRNVRNLAAVGDKFPSVAVDFGFPPLKVNMEERLKGKKTIVVGLPGAFTPTWSSKQVPGYLAKQAELKAKGIDEVLVYCVNDGAVMEGWGKDQGIEGSMITFLADPRSELTKALDLVLDDPGAMAVLGNPRCKRFALFVDDGVIKGMAVAGGDVPDEATFVEAMLEKC